MLLKEVNLAWISVSWPFLPKDSIKKKRIPFKAFSSVHLICFIISVKDILFKLFQCTFQNSFVIGSVTMHINSIRSYFHPGILFIQRESFSPHIHKTMISYQIFKFIRRLCGSSWFLYRVWFIVQLKSPARTTIQSCKTLLRAVFNFLEKRVRSEPIFGAYTLKNEKLNP